jgi:hypothetical protein
VGSRARVYFGHDDEAAAALGKDTRKANQPVCAIAPCSRHRGHLPQPERACDIRRNAEALAKERTEMMRIRKDHVQDPFYATHSRGWGRWSAANNRLCFAYQGGKRLVPHLRMTARFTYPHRLSPSSTRDSRAVLRMTTAAQHGQA